jgi:hypothetical protein
MTVQHHKIHHKLCWLLVALVVVVDGAIAGMLLMFAIASMDGKINCGCCL